MKIEAIDLFCGIGGLTYGLRKAGINVLAGLDNDKYCEYSYKENNHAEFILADIAKYDFKDMFPLFSEKSAQILVGCAPCQPFSTHSHKRKNRRSDEKWNLITHFTRAVKELRPDVISMENVRGLVKTRVFKRFVTDLEKIGYHLDFKVIYCPDYGIPQSRSRLVLLGSRLGEILIPEKTHAKDEYKTVRDSIGSLPRIRAGQADDKDKIHRAKSLSPVNLLRIKQSKPKGTWRDWDKSLLPRCYKKRSGGTYTAVYGRMSWDDVSPTITTQFSSYGTGRFGHPEQDRALSVREGALLQTFPRSYKFKYSLGVTHVGRQIGNAVPPRLGYVIGKAIGKHVRDYYARTE